jgi:Tol biopolymer transport system component
VLAANNPSTRGTAESLSLLPTGPGQARVLDRDGLVDFGWGAWLPDGKAVVFSASKADGGSHLYVQAPDRKPRPIGPERARIPPFGNSVSPDGKYVVALAGGQALLVPLDGTGEARAVPGLAPQEGDRVVQWSSDSRAVYAYRVGERPMRVWLVDIESGRRRPWKEIAVDDALGGVQLRVTPDGKTWLYAGRRILSELYLVEGLR